MASTIATTKSDESTQANAKGERRLHSMTKFLTKIAKMFAKSHASLKRASKSFEKRNDLLN